jgi:hypothetical protein
MNPTPTSSTKNSKSSDTTTSEASKPVEVSTAAGKPSDTKTPEAPADTATTKDAKAPKKEEKRRIISVAFPNKTVRQLKLLASVEGVTVASIVIASVTKSVAKRLPAALEALKSDVEG